MSLFEAKWINNTICLDTSCVFSGRLTTLRYPERELISVPAEDIYTDHINHDCVSNVINEPLEAIF